MHLKHIIKRSMAVILLLSMMMGLSACSSNELMNTAFNYFGTSTSVKPGERLPGMAWINSDIEGSIDESTQLELKDDFHTAVNRDWLLETTVEGDEQLDTFTTIGDTLYENQLRLLSPGGEYDADPSIMSSETLEHLHSLVLDMMDLAGNQDKRNELGVEPLRPYLEAIEQIDSIDEMTEYLKNSDNQNFTVENFFNFYVDTPANSRDFYTVHITSPEHTLLADFFQYGFIKMPTFLLYQQEKAAVEHVLGQLGYTPDQIAGLFLDCYRFESKISFLTPSYEEQHGESYGSRGNKIYTLDDIQKLQGNFPLVELLEEAGVAHSETFRVYEPGLLDFMGSYYQDKNLDKLKAYFMIHTVLDALPYLDETCQTMGQEIQEATRDLLLISDPTATLALREPEDPEDAAKVQLFNKYILQLIYEPFQLAYIGSYCDSTEKQNILNLMEDIRDYYIELLSSTEWLSQETREKAVEKMVKMEFMVMYPDVLPDYSQLIYRNYEEGGNLLEAAAAARAFKKAPDTERINQPVRRSDWDLNVISTLVVNACNVVELNSIMILSGVLADGFVYDENAPVEQNYARLGTILGHEITHAFDTTGYTLDAEGLPFGWWTNDDEVAFRLRSNNLANHYSRMKVIPGVDANYQGQVVQGEAISDMGGVKCMLTLAENIPDFDYDLFFRSYASLWRTQMSFINEVNRANDVHPLGFLRTNVTLQQFDKFNETYGIGPGDGMYLAPEDRILVW